MRAEAHADPQTRDATPALTVVKHGLHDWIQERLASLVENWEVVEPDSTLRSTDLLCRGEGKMRRIDAPKRPPPRSERPSTKISMN
jgi:hypothetical protein